MKKKLLIPFLALATTVTAKVAIVPFNTPGYLGVVAITNVNRDFAEESVKKLSTHRTQVFIAETPSYSKVIVGGVNTMTEAQTLCDSIRNLGQDYCSAYIVKYTIE